MEHILFIHAHPDDFEMLAAGTAAHLAAKGHAIHVVTMTPGDCGSAELPPDEIAAVRRREAAASARIIGAGYYCAEFRDFQISVDHAALCRVVEVLRQIRPSIVFTASPVDYLFDHENTSIVVRNACFVAPTRNFSTGAESPAPALEAIPHLYFMDPMGGVDRDNAFVAPDFVVNIETTLATKLQMLSQHESQRAWLMKQHGMDEYLNFAAGVSRERGRLAGWTAGEGFRQYAGHPYPSRPLVQELLGDPLVRHLKRAKSVAGDRADAE